VYRIEINKRCGLINGIKSVTKTLFGIMNADNEKLINDYHCYIIQTRATCIKNQIKIINSIIAHVNNLKKKDRAERKRSFRIG